MSGDAAPISPADGAACALADAQLVVAAMGRLADAAARASTWAAAERREVLAQVRRAIDGLTTVRGSVLVAEQEAQTWKGTGSGTFETWVGTASREGTRAGAKEVRQAEQLDAVPAASAAVAAGTIGLAHAQIIATLAAQGTERQRAAVRSAAGQAQLLAWAQVQDAATFAITVARWAASIDPDGLERAHREQRTHRYLQVAELPHGTVVKGQLDTAAGRTLILALEALDPKPAPDDRRDAGQRRADALEAMAATVLASPHTTPGAHVPPQVSILLTAETFHAATADLAARRASLATFGFPTHPDGDQGGAGQLGGASDLGGASELGGAGDLDRGGCEVDRAGEPGAGARRYAPATWEDGTPIPTTVLAAALCDCVVTRIVLDAESTPVDLGRSRRLFTGAQRRAVIARDRHCSWPGCTQHARWCVIHHIDWWYRDNGPTSVDNAVLLCVFHHGEAHRRDLTITRHVNSNSHGHSSGTGVPGDATALVTYDFQPRIKSDHAYAPPSRGTPSVPPVRQGRPPVRPVSVRPRARSERRPRGEPADQLDLGEPPGQFDC